MPEPASADAMTISYDWDRRDYLQFYREFLRYPPNRLVYWTMIVMLFIVTIGVTRSFWILWRDVGLEEIWLDVAGFYLFVAGFLWFWTRGVRELGAWIHPRWRSGPRHVTLDAAHGLSRGSRTRTKRIPWAKVARVAETDDLLMVFHTFNEGFYVPKRAFESAEQLGQFRRLVRERIGGKARLRGEAAPGEPDPNAGPRL